MYRSFVGTFLSLFLIPKVTLLDNGHWTVAGKYRLRFVILQYLKTKMKIYYSSNFCSIHLQAFKISSGIIL